VITVLNTRLYCSLAFKVHHEYKQNTILASMHEHPVDYVITLAAPALLAVIVVHPHSVTLFQWIAWLLVANIGATEDRLT